MPSEQIPEEDLVLNFHYESFKHVGMLDLAEEFNRLREVTRDKYIKYLAELGNKILNNKSIKETFMLNKDCSLWWFTEIMHKDSFQDSFFDDLNKVKLINDLIRARGLSEIKIISDSILLNCVYRARKINMFPFILKTLLRRFKLAFCFIKTKAKLNQIKVLDSKTEPGKSTLFFSHYPSNWSKDLNGKMSDRFFRDLPNKSEEYGYLINCLNADKGIKENISHAYFIQHNISMFQAILKAFDLSNLFRYLKNRKRLNEYFVFENINIMPIFDRYMAVSVIFNEYYYWLLIKGTEAVIKKIKPRNIIAVGEFGPSAKAIVAGAKINDDVVVVWLQHAAITKWKLWYFNDPAEIDLNQKGGRIKHINNMPVADWFIIWGERSKELLGDYGYPKERMVMLGNPRYDHFVNISNEKMLKAGPIVFAPTINLEELKILADYSIKTKMAFPDKEVILKLHPRYREMLKKPILQMFSAVENIGVRISTDNIENYYHHNVVFVSGLSTIGIEASYFGAKVISYVGKYNTRFTPDWTVERSYVSSSDELIKSIRNIENVPVIDWGKYYLRPGESTMKINEFLGSTRIR